MPTFLEREEAQPVHARTVVEAEDRACPGGGDDLCAQMDIDERIPRVGAGELDLGGVMDASGRRGTSRRTGPDSIGLDLRRRGGPLWLLLFLARPVGDL